MDWDRPLTDQISDAFGPSWADRATQQMQSDSAAFQQGGVKGLLANTGDTQDLASGFGAGTIRAYHGSPYDFTKFKASKIGTGEGNQSYGYGTYFAENPETARTYSDKLGHPVITHPQFGKVDFDAVHGNLANTAVNAVPDLGMRQARDIADHITLGIQNGGDVPTMEKWVSKSVDEPKKTAWLAALQHAKEYSVEQRHGNLYEVDINAEPEQFLDWDKPLLQQPKSVQKAIMPYLSHRSGTTRKTMSGGDAYYDLTESSSPNPDGLVWNTAYTKKASALLQKQGVPGIKYLDQGSRGILNIPEQQRLLDVAESRLSEWKNSKHPNASDQIAMYERQIASMKKNIADAQAHPPTSNYVVFDPDIVNMVGKR